MQAFERMKPDEFLAHHAGNTGSIETRLVHIVIKSQSPQCKEPHTQEAHNKYLLNELYLKQIPFKIQGKSLENKVPYCR